jgi:hypothetical protein
MDEWDRGAQASLLKRLKPTDFQSYAAFAAWRGDIVQLLLSVLALASQEIARKNSRLASSCRMLMARLKVSSKAISRVPQVYLSTYAS